MAMSRRSAGLSLAAILVLVLVLASCEVPLHRETRFAMSTTLTVLVSGRPRPDWTALFDLAAAKAREFDHRYPDSPIWELNREGRGRPPQEVLLLAKAVAERSGGAFDPTILPLTALWSFDSGGRLPAEQEIAGARSRVDYSRLVIGPDGEVALPRGFGLDLGGIAKGAVVDLLGAYLLRQGYEDFLIDAGGDILICGRKGGTAAWRIAIRHPRNNQAIVGVLTLGEKGKMQAIVTSGDYERFFEQGGVRYHHILDPRTGYPARGLASVTVIAPTCAEADALATAAFVLGPDRGRWFFEERPDTEGLLIGERDGRLEAHGTAGFPLSVEALQLEAPTPP